jgi:hypothetical protein
LHIAETLKPHHLSLKLCFCKNNKIIRGRPLASAGTTMVSREASASEVGWGDDGDSRQEGHNAENDDDGGSDCSTEPEDEGMSAKDKAAIAAAHARIKASMVIMLLCIALLQRLLLKNSYRKT